MITDKEKLLHEELLSDERNFCVYCGKEKVMFSCCGEVHFQSYKDMTYDEQNEFRAYEKVQK